MKKILILVIGFVTSFAAESQTVSLKVGGIPTPYNATDKVEMNGVVMTAAEAYILQNKTTPVVTTTTTTVTLLVGGVPTPFNATDQVVYDGKTMTAAEAAKQSVEKKEKQKILNGVAVSFDQNGNIGGTVSFNADGTPITISGQVALPGTYAALNNKNWRNAVVQQAVYNNNQQNNYYAGQFANPAEQYNGGYIPSPNVGGPNGGTVASVEPVGWKVDSMGRRYFWNGSTRQYPN